ncbi:MAG: calcium/sodium antiporter [Muribaculaceae bacterium]|nr:calcium/sodium antiporter [Muribaculaceae bacterium]
MLHDIIFLLLGLVLLVVGANYVTDGAVAVAKRFKVSNLIIGLTVVALGSTLPDMVVCIESAFEDKPAMAIGEVIGSNIFDLLLVVGIMGIVRPMKVSGVMLYQDLPILFIASAALWFAGDTVLFDGLEHNIINRSAGVMLIVIFIFYMWFMILSSRKDKLQTSSGEETASINTQGDNALQATLSEQNETDSEGGIINSHSANSERRSLKLELSELRRKQWFSWILIIAGLVALVIGGNWVVDGASGLALKIGMSQGMVALTVVAIGNALPDLVTSITATVKGASGIALGNIVGSCIINALLSIGLSSLVIPLKADTIGFVDFITLVGASALIWIIPLLSKSHKMGRIFGIILTLLYVAYMIFTVVRG